MGGKYGYLVVCRNVSMTRGEIDMSRKELTCIHICPSQYEKGTHTALRFEYARALATTHHALSLSLSSTTDIIVCSHLRIMRHGFAWMRYCIALLLPSLPLPQTQSIILSSSICTGRGGAVAIEEGSRKCM